MHTVYGDCPGKNLMRHHYITRLVFANIQKPRVHFEPQTDSHVFQMPDFKRLKITDHYGVRMKLAAPVPLWAGAVQCGGLWGSSLPQLRAPPPGCCV